MVEILDQRVSTNWVPAPAILDCLLPHIPEALLAGVRRIVLLDDESGAAKGTALGKYMPASRDNPTQIAMFFAPLATLPDRIKQFEPFWVDHIIRNLMHEIFHHKQMSRRRRLRKEKREESMADCYADEMSRSLYFKLVDHEAVRDEWRAIEPIFEEWRKQQLDRLEK